MSRRWDDAMKTKLFGSPGAAVRTLTSCLAIACGLTSAASAAPPRPGAREQAAPREPWVSEVVVLQPSSDPDKPDSFTPYGLWRKAWNSWIGPADMPADLRGRTLNTISFVALDVDAHGKVTGCRVARPSEDKRLDEIACRLLTERGRFDISYEGPGKPTAATRIMSVRWETLDAETRARRDRMPIAMAPPAPPAPTFAGGRVWPRLFHSERVAPVSLPAIQADYPRNAGRPKDGIVSLDLLVTGPGGITGCEIGIGSGNPALDEAACRVARRLDLRYARPCDACGENRLPLQIVWRKRGSHIRLPLVTPYYRAGLPMLRDPADSRTATTFRIAARALAPAASRSDFADLPDKSHPVRTIRINLSIGVDGRTTGCTVQTSSGNPAIDQRVCEWLYKKARFEPRTDVFGDPVPSQRSFGLDLNTLL